MILNHTVWEHAVFAGVLMVLNLLKVGDRYTGLLIVSIHLLKQLFKRILRGWFEYLSLLHYISTGQLSLSASLPLKPNSTLVGHVAHLF